MEEKTGPSVLILWDIENLFIPAMKDPELQKQRKEHILLAIAHAIEQTAKTRFGKVGMRIGAISVPRAKKGYSAIYARRKIREEMADMASLGYNVLLVQQTADAADNGIVKIGRALVKTGEFSACVLGTGDGKEPFTTFLHELKALSIPTHVVSYQYVPETIKQMGASYSIIAGDVRGVLKKLFGSQEDVERFAEEIAPIHETAALVTLRESVRKFFDRKNGEAIPEEHQRWIQKLIPFTKTKNRRKRVGLTHREITDYLMHHRDRIWQEPRPSEDEIRDLLAGLIGFTDLFERGTTYFLNHLSRLLENNQ